MSLTEDILDIIRFAVGEADPYKTVYETLEKTDFGNGALTVFSIGKAAIPMAKAASDLFGDRIKKGLAVTKYGHTGDFSSPYFDVIESAHPVSDENSIKAAETALDIADGLGADDTCIILLSGGGSALFEKSLISPELQRDITSKLLARGAQIDEINAVRRRISCVKGGKFAARCYPAKVCTFALSDVLSNDRSVIASGISVKDSTGADFIKAVVDKYLYDIPGDVTELLYVNDDIEINDGGYYFVGDINSLCDAAKKRASELGYDAAVVSRALTGEARDRAVEIIEAVEEGSGKCAYIYGGETTVTLNGSGLGGRNQEMALAAAIALHGRRGIVFASAGSDGTDGPTDAAGGLADGGTYDAMVSAGCVPEEYLMNNDSYHALKKAGTLIVSGPTGTNVNDITVILTE